MKTEEKVGQTLPQTAKHQPVLPSAPPLTPTDTSPDISSPSKAVDITARGINSECSICLVARVSLIVYVCLVYVKRFMDAKFSEMTTF